jgi:hypothetical protein
MAYIEDTNLIEEIKSLAILMGGKNIFPDEAKESVLRVINEQPAADVAPLTYAYWDWQHDGSHFCSECGTDALFNYEGEEFCSLWCPHCGCFMTHQEDQI